MGGSIGNIKGYIGGYVGIMKKKMEATFRVMGVPKIRGNLEGGIQGGNIAIYRV